MHAAGAEIYVSRCWLKGYNLILYLIYVSFVTTFVLYDIQPSLGGWSLSDPFPVMAANEQSRLNFANKCIELVEEMNFDG